MSFRIATVLLLAASCPAMKLDAQRVSAEAYLSHDQIKIGEQLELHLAVRYHEGSKKSVVTWPEFHDSIAPGIDIVKDDSISTKLADRPSVLYEQAKSMTITAFDSGRYNIPPIRFIVDSDTVQTDTLHLYVSTVPVDTTQPIKDIKDIYDVPPAPAVAPQPSPVNWWLWGGIAAAVIAAGIIAWILTRKKPEIVVPAPAVHVLLPHERVLEELAALGRKKQWLSGESKAYHVAQTEILRGWIAERYRIPAREMTTTEIIRSLHVKQVHPSGIMQLERILNTADLVKFAKAFPSNEEIETNLGMAMEFVRATANYPAV